MAFRHRRALPALACVSLLALTLIPSASANHTQDLPGGGTVTFDHKTGNEWWVEVIVKSSSSVSKVEVMDDGGAWATMAAKPEWGAGTYALSYHVEPGHRVLFRATTATGTMTSCWFTHPAGAEQCGGTGTFDASFTGVRGNAWWVQAQVTSTSGPSVANVDVRLDGGAWKPVARQSWGWGSSYHIPEGTIVQLRATATDGQTDLSSCRRWIPPSGQDAQIVPCSATAFDATFSGVKGNEWWVQANVAGNKPIHQVAVRIDCEPEWHLLAKQSWGGWAASFHIPAGSKLDFQARTSTFESDVSGGYVWPQATPTAGCPQGDWPRQGSFVTYDVTSGVCGGGECFSTFAVFHTVYTNGVWKGGCRGTDVHTTPDGGRTEKQWTSDHTGLAPPHLPTRTTIGAAHRPDMMQAHYGWESCGMGWISSPVYVVSRGPTETAMRDRDGNPVMVDAWYAQSRDEVDNLYTTHWDTDIGLVLDLYSHPRRSGQGSGSMVMTGTDAPLP